MDKEITFEMLSEAVRYFRNEPWKTVENDIIKVELSDLGVEKITLKPMGKLLMDKFLEDTEKLGKKGKVIQLFGMDIVVSDKVKGVEFKW